jgi:hypothetical protein
LAPFEEVGVAAVGDDDVCERAGGERDVSERLLVGRVRQSQLEHPDGFAAVGRRSDDLNARRGGLVAGVRAAPSFWPRRMSASPLMSAMRNATAVASSASASVARHKLVDV